MTEHQISITRVFAFPVEVLFASWTDPELVQAWLAEEAEIDARPGGTFRFLSSGDEDAPGDHVCSGPYRSFKPERELIHEWTYSGTMSPTPITTEVTVRFRSLSDGSSEMVFSETGAMLTDPEENELAAEAWNAAFDELEAAIDELYAPE